jgi:uncharacterized protein (DUF427 family)
VCTTFAGETIADSKRMMLLQEPSRLPVYYFPVSDTRMDLLASSGKAEGYLTLTVGSRTAEGAAWTKPEYPGYVAFDWPAMDNWYEEDDEVYKHPRDPYHRVDVVRSSRHVRVILGGQTVAETSRPSLLFETGLPARYYIPRHDVRLDLLTPTESHTQCPYKGIASYWSATIGGKTYEDIVWSYPMPIPECPKIEQLMCFYNEKVDAIEVDGEVEVKPVTKWS